MPLRARICLLLFCLPTLACGMLGIDSWPYSCFPMYSTPMGQSQFEDYSLHILTADGSSLPVRERACLWPLDAQRLSERVHDLRDRPDGERRVEALMQYVAQRSLRYYKRNQPTLQPVQLELRLSQGSYSISQEPAPAKRVTRSQVIARTTLGQD